MIEQLDRFIADLEHEQGLIVERLRLAREFRASLDGDVAAPPVVEPKVPKVAPTKRAPSTAGHRKKSRAKQPRITCPDCGENIAKSRFDAHRLAKHPGSAAKPVGPIAPPSSAPTVKDKVFRCGEDDREFPTLGDLTHHAITEHRRSLTQGERIPVTPDAVSAAA